MEPLTITTVAGKLVFSGACLSIGFWMGKKITNRIDTFLITHSQEYKDLIKSRKDVYESPIKETI